MSIHVRIRTGLAPNESGDGGGSEGDIRGPSTDIIENTGGVVDLANGHLLVEENDTPDMNVKVSAGVGYIPNTDFDELDSDSIKFWEAVVSEAETLAISANSSGSTRIDLVCLKLDPTIEPDEYASNIAELIIVEGTPGAGTPATPDYHLLLAEVEEIENASITDSREQLTIKSVWQLEKATGAEINTGTDDAKFATPKAIADSGIGKAKATGAEINTGTDDAKFVTPKAIADSKLADFIRGDGWVSANETWEYASASTITVPSGAASKYAVGDRIKLTQTTVKYFYILAVADTLLTVTGGTTYTVEDAAITLPYYSHEATPIGMPNYFAYTPTWTLKDGTLDTTYTTREGFFNITAGKLFFQWYMRLATVSTATANKAVQVDSPIAASYMKLSNTAAPLGFGRLYDASSTTNAAAGFAWYLGSGNLFHFGGELTNWGAADLGESPTITLATNDRLSGQIEVLLT